MAKERTRSVNGEGKTKKKKVSADKVRKRERKDAKDNKHRDDKRGNKEQSQQQSPGSESQEAQVALDPLPESPRLAVPHTQEIDGAADEYISLADNADPIALAESEVRRLKKEKKKERALEEMVLKRLMDQELGSSPTASGRHAVAEKERRAKRNAERKALKAAVRNEPEATSTTGISDTNASEPAALFTIDPERPAVAPVAGAAPPEEESLGGSLGLAGVRVPAPSGLNRTARRRLKLIERQRVAIHAELGVPADSDERKQEVEDRLEKWTQALDTKTREREEKKRQRKAKEAARLRNKRGKVLTGRKLAERQKQIKTEQRQKARRTRAISGSRGND